MAEYNMQGMTLPGEGGKRILYPRMKLYGQMDLVTIPYEIAYQMGQGYSVKIDNSGVCTLPSACGKTVNGKRRTGNAQDFILRRE